ncbi:MAG: hypothetical protein ACM3IJ_05400 [Candidatus Levyibacteriota bacterium]
MDLRERVSDFIARKRMPQWEKDQKADSAFFIESAELTKALFERATGHLDDSLPKDPFDMSFIFLTLAILYNRQRIEETSASREQKERMILTGESIRRNIILQSTFESPNEYIAGFESERSREIYEQHGEDAARVIFGARYFPAGQLAMRMKLELPIHLTMMQQIRTGQRLTA